VAFEFAERAPDSGMPGHPHPGHGSATPRGQIVGGVIMTFVAFLPLVFVSRLVLRGVSPISNPGIVVFLVLVVFGLIFVEGRAIYHLGRTPAKGSQIFLITSELSKRIFATTVAFPTRASMSEPSTIRLCSLSDCRPWRKCPLARSM